MKKNLKIIFTLIFIISLCLGSGIILNRIKAENKNNIYEIGIGEDSISNMNKNELKYFYEQMNQVGIKSIVVKNESLYQISEDRSLQISTLGEFSKENKEYKNIDISQSESDENIVISLDKKDFFSTELDNIETYLSKYEIFNNDDRIIFYIDSKMEIENKDNKIINPILTNQFFIDEKKIGKIKLNKFNPVLGIANTKNKSDQQLLLKQIKYMSKKYGIYQVQLRGQSLFGYPDNIENYFNELKKDKITVFLTEFQNSVGLTTYSKLNRGNITRAHEVSVNELHLNKNELAARISRAVKERNIRFISLDDCINYKNSKTVKNSTDDLIYSIKEAKEQISDKYSLGIAKPVPTMEKYNISIVFIGISFAALIAITFLSMFEKKLKMSMGLFLLVIVGASFIMKNDIGILIKLYAFSVAIVGAFAAVVVPYKSKTKLFTAKYLMSIGIAISTGIIIASIMYGTDYMLKLKSFSGVKFLYVLPPILISIWVVLSSNIEKIKQLNSINCIKNEIRNMMKNIKLHHFAIGICTLIVLYIYVNRSGNGGHVSEFELQIRALMEKVLYVRPRTKEFLIGYPALFMAYYLHSKNVVNSQYILIVGSIATMSTVNTFTHLHTPFLYSLLRTTYGVVFGAIIGIFYICIFNLIIKFINNKKKN
ncbi:MAG: DUF5693 family protein [Romboutsia sp.]